MEEDSEKLINEIYKTTDIPRSPISGIVKGYHMIPYVLVGPDDKEKSSSIKLTGKITVSPKLIFSINSQDEQFSDIFEEPEPFMDAKMVTRTFSYRTLPQKMKKNISIKGNQISVEYLTEPDTEVLQSVLEELNQKELINTGVIWCPNPKFYPVSLERFIYSILEKEFE